MVCATFQAGVSAAAQVPDLALVEALPVSDWERFKNSADSKLFRVPLLAPSKYGDLHPETVSGAREIR